MQKAFRDMVGQARGAATAEQRQRQRLLDGMSPESPPESPRAAGTPDVTASSRLAGVRPDQSANVLMGSPEAAARASTPGLPRPGGASFDHDTGAVKFDEGVVRESVRASIQRRQAGPATYMSGKRYQDLKRQVEQQLEAYKAKAKHQRQVSGGRGMGGRGRMEGERRYRGTDKGGGRLLAAAWQHRRQWCHSYGKRAERYAQVMECTELQPTLAAAYASGSVCPRRTRAWWMHV